MNRFFSLIFLVFSVSLFSFSTESSYPYLSGYTWWHFCNWRLTHPDYGKDSYSSFPPQQVKNGDTVFVEYDCLDEFVNEYLPHLQAKIILITANYGYHADMSLPNRFAFLLDDEKIVAWFVQNIDRAPTEKLIPIPIGLASNYWPHGETAWLDRLIPSALKNEVRKTFIYLNFSLSPEREACANHFVTLGIPFTPPKSYPGYLGDLSRSIFVISPPGGGVDCHRTWEALLFGCYPVMKTSFLDPLFADLPVVLVDDWADVTGEFLEEKYRELKKKKWSREKLYFPYWEKKVYEIQEKIRSFVSDEIKYRIEAHVRSNSWKEAYYDLLPKILKDHNYSTILEVGVALGGHAETLLTQTNISSYIGVDPYHPYDSNDGFQIDISNYSKQSLEENFDALYRWVTSCRLAPFSSRCRLIRKCSIEASFEIEDESIDCIFIDGDHRYEAVVADLNAWLPKLKKGCLMVGDDYSMEPVARAVNEFCKEQGKDLFFFTSQSGYKLWAFYT